MTSTLRRLYQGQSLLRIHMNEGFRRHAVRGFVVDVGGGRNPDYFEYFRDGGVSRREAVDQSLSPIDFERDALPFEDGVADTVVCANMLEHIYRYAFLLGEMRRILRPGGTLVGFVPFLIQYHPDPHDYSRYTKEALERMLLDAGFREPAIERVGGGPFSANFNNLVLSVPRVLRPLLYPGYALLDWVFLLLRPGAAERYPLGFIFTSKK